MLRRDLKKDFNLSEPLQTSIKTLVTVTEMLTKHKQKYTEMINNANAAGSGANPMPNIP